jgi:hypothetical protein
MGENMERCRACGHLIAAHDPAEGCTERVPGTKERMPGACGCGLPPILADVIPFRTRSARDMPPLDPPSEDAPDD